MRNSKRPTKLTNTINNNNNNNKLILDLSRFIPFDHVSTHLNFTPGECHARKLNAEKKRISKTHLICDVCGKKIESQKYRLSVSHMGSQNEKKKPNKEKKTAKQVIVNCFFYLLGYFTMLEYTNGIEFVKRILSLNLIRFVLLDTLSLFF